MKRKLLYSLTAILSSLGLMVALNGTALAAGDVNQGGNAYGVPMNIGTTDNYSLNLITNGTSRLTISNAGAIGLAAPATTSDSSASVMLGANAATSKGLVVQGKSGQTANLQEWQSSAGTALATLNSSGALGVKGLTVTGASSLNGATTVNGPLTANNGAVIGTNVSGILSLSVVDSTGRQMIVANSAQHTIGLYAHLVTDNSSGTTTVSRQAAAGNGAQVTVTGNDTAGTITVTTSASSLSNGLLATVVFAKAYDKTPNVIISSKGPAASRIQPYTSWVGTSMFSIGGGELSSIQPNTTYMFSYFVAQ